MNRPRTRDGVFPDAGPVTNILGLPFFRGDLKQALDLLCSAVERGCRCQACVLPVNNAVWAGDDPKLMAIYRGAFVCLADGVPLIWASKLLGRPIRGRSTGYDLLPELCRAAAGRGWGCYFLGGGEGVAESAAKRLAAQYPGLEVSGTFSPAFKERFTPRETQEMVERVNRSGARILFVSLSSPKQDVWIAEALPDLQVNLAIGVGAALDVAAGRFKRPPAWIRDNGMEWAHRLMQEPGRLYRRYLLQAPRFVPRIFSQIVHERRQRVGTDQPSAGSTASSPPPVKGRPHAGHEE